MLFCCQLHGSGGGILGGCRDLLWEELFVRFFLEGGGQREFGGYDNFRRETGERGKEKAGEGIPLKTVRNSGEL